MNHGSYGGCRRRLESPPPCQGVEIQLAITDEDIQATFPVMHQLRPHLEPTDYVPTIRRMMDRGYHLVYGTDDGHVVCVAGFRIFEMLFRGHFLYVDDLVTDAAHRSRGHGKAMMDWLQARAREEGCAQLALDSGLQRADAHRFYSSYGLDKLAYNFTMEL